MKTYILNYILALFSLYFPKSLEFVIYNNQPWKKVASNRTKYRHFQKIPFYPELSFFLLCTEE